MSVLRQLSLLPKQMFAPNLLRDAAVNYNVVTRRFLSVTVPCRLKEILIREENDVTIIEGSYIESDRKGKVYEPDSEEAKQMCPLCPNRLQSPVKYTDVLILSQFIRSDGRLLPRQVTGLCFKAQIQLQRVVHQAQRAGLMPELRPPHRSGLPRTSPHSNYKWKRYNAYFDE